MPEYESIPRTIEAFRWAPGELDGLTFNEVVVKVEERGGMARVIGPYPGIVDGASCIQLLTINGWSTMEPGHYAMIGDTFFDFAGERVRDVYPCDPETFAGRWRKKA